MRYGAYNEAVQRIIDKAMGSGHFLVESCRFLGEALYDAARRCDELAANAEKLAESYRASATTKPEHQALADEQATRAAALRQRVWVTNRSEDALTLWRDYNGRATVEQRIEELKHDLAADGFCLQPFFATESAFLAVLFTFNLLSLYQHQMTPNAPYRQPGTLRVAVFLCGAVLGVMGCDMVVKLSAAWGGLRKHKPLVAATLDWLKCASPKVVPPEDRLATGGGMI
jgi:hypothetical protein